MSSENTEDFETFESDNSSSSWEDVDEVADEATCHPLLMNHLILEKIFDFLPTSDLLKSRLVCKEWNKTALLRKVLGCKFKITVNKTNFDRLLKIANNSAQPFCRKFDFRLLELEYDKVSKFIRIFGNRVSSLGLKYCTDSSTQSVIKILNCPRLERLKIYGALPPITEENFHDFAFRRLKVISLHSSLDGQVDQPLMKLLLKHAPNIETINIGQNMSLWKDFCCVISTMTDSKLCHVGLSGLEEPLEVDHFKIFFNKHLFLRHLNIQNCIVREAFLEQLLIQSSNYLTALTIDGTQQEILSRAFRDVSLPNLKYITLQIDGISISDGKCIIQSCPKLKRLTVVGIFCTNYVFEDSNLISIALSQTNFSTFFSRANSQPVISQEKEREFLKLVSLFHLQPIKFKINLPFSAINSRCLRIVYKFFPDLEHLTLSHNSAKECLVGLTGIPYRVCKRIAHCKSFAVLYRNQATGFSSVANLKKLKRLEITIVDENINVELTLLCIAYGICELACLEELALSNFKISDVALMILAQKMNLLRCKINASEDRWTQFKSAYMKQTIKSFLLPPQLYENIQCAPPSGQFLGTNNKILRKVFNYLDSKNIFEARKVSKYWHAFSESYLHQQCSSSEYLLSNLVKRLTYYENKELSPPSPSNRNTYHLGEILRDTPWFSKILKIWSAMKRETTIAVVSLDRSAVGYFHRKNREIGGDFLRPSCQKRRQLEYWYYPDGTDGLVYNDTVVTSDAKLDEAIGNGNIEVLLVIGCWGRKDSGLLHFFNPLWSVSSLHIIGLQKEVLDLILPKVTVMKNVESLHIRPLLNSSTYCDITKTHLQILRNASFKLKQLTMQLDTPSSEAVVEFIQSQRFTLEAFELHSSVNISDRLTFSMPQLKILQLDEPPGCRLWTTLNVHSSLETINFGRTGCSLNQVKNKSSPKVDPLDADFEHTATEVLCDVNWFLETAVNRQGGAHKSILQQSSDSALKFFMHFPYLTSLTLRSVHAHYGLLQGIFKQCIQLKKLTLVNATGVTDEILTGFSKDILNEMDIMNPFQISRKRDKATVQGKRCKSIRNLKCLTYLSLDDQPLCTDFSIIFGILKLHQLQYFSCKKWKITDVAVRAITDVLTSMKEISTDDCTHVSKYALDYFRERKGAHFNSPSEE